LKTAFELAGRLRQAGYIAELDLDGRKTTAMRAIEVHLKEPIFMLIDNARQARSEFKTIDELLKRLEAKRAD
jgi:hypothetical protein